MWKILVFLDRILIFIYLISYFILLSLFKKGSLVNVERKIIDIKTEKKKDVLEDAIGKKNNWAPEKN